MGNNKTLKYIAGACFAIYAVLDIVSLIQNGFYVWSLLVLIGSFLIAVSLFTSIPILTTAGSALCLVTAARALILYIGYIRDDGIPKRYLLYAIMFLVIWLLLFIAGINTKSTKSIGIVAGVIAAARFVAIIIGNLVDTGSVRLAFTDILSYLVVSIGALLIGLSAENSAVRKGGAVASSNKAKIQQGSDNVIERLTKLKALLDNGIITQEEFEMKKKQIMGM